MAGQPLAWAAVGSGNDDSNHARTAGLNGSSGSVGATRSRYRRPMTGPVSYPFASEVASVIVSVPTMFGWMSQTNLYSPRSEEHKSELQSLMRNSYAVFCVKKQ